MRGQRAGAGRVLRPGTHDHGQASAHQPFDTFHALLVAQQGPVAHGTAIHQGRHADLNEVAAGSDQGVKVRLTVGRARGHQGGNRAAEDIPFHGWDAPFK
ncbi:hypothetical protein D9M69_581060 [compost metagenome]